jgi:hypothetical protein
MPEKATSMATDHLARILEDQVIHVKRGRFNSFGFEPAWNSYFDFYLSPKYLDPPLLQLEDVTFHLFLRKNLNDQNPSWKMPSIRQMRRRLSIGQHKLEHMMTRLDQAQLLKKQSGYRRGPEGENVPNHYILSDPIQTLDEFLVVAAAGGFGQPLKAEWLAFLQEDPCTQNEYTPVSEMSTLPVLKMSTPSVLEMSTDKQTSFQKQTFQKQTGNESEEDKLWNQVLAGVKMQLPANTFYSFVADTRLAGIDAGVAQIVTPKAFAIDWLSNRMSNNLRGLLNTELRLRDGEAAGKIQEIRFAVVANSE